MKCPCGGKRRVLEIQDEVDGMDTVERKRGCLRCGKITITLETTVKTLPGRSRAKRARLEQINPPVG